MTDLSNKKILVVEDETYLRELYVDILSEEGFSVDQAANGYDGYLAILKGGYDLVLLDIMLPKIDGLEVLKKLKNGPKPKKSNGKIVVLTNLSKDTAIADSVAMGVAGYLIKSDLTPGELVENVKHFLEIN
ncbi:response regulator [Patescibacteria group bacterium]|nr:response regulator [Patescibacteria group bacterium]